MKVKRLLLFAAVFCALLGYVVIFESPALKKSKAAPQQLVKVFSFPESAIKSIEISRGPVQATLTRHDRLWELSSPDHAVLNQDQVESLLSSITGLVKIEVVSEGTEDLSQYGLGNPDMSITLALEAAAPVTLFIGNNCPTGVSMYGLIKGTKEVMQIGTLLRFSINSFLDIFARPASR